MSDIAPRCGPRVTDADSPLTRARLAAGLTQGQLAKMIGTTQAMICRWERGERTPKLSSLQRLATALGVDWTDLVQ